MAIERNTQFASVVSDLPAAWEFVMQYLEEVGPRPRITISPLIRFTEIEDAEYLFEVAVSGMVEV